LEIQDAKSPDHQSPVANRHSPIGSRHPAIIDHQWPITNHPIANHQSLNDPMAQ
jgi:hypothetical protein